MAHKTPIQHQREQLNHVFRRRALCLLALFTLLILILAARLLQLQWSEYARYSTLSRHNQLTLIPLAPARGLITDRHGVRLAINMPTSTLSLMPNRRGKLSQTINALNTIIPISTHEKNHFFSSLSQYRHFQPVPLKHSLTENEVALFYTNEFKYPGALIQTQLKRYYPTHDAMGPIIGYTGKMNTRDQSTVNMEEYQAESIIGKTGVEKEYENILHGKSGANIAQTNANAHIVALITHHPAVGGRNLMLTIDAPLQETAHNLLKHSEGSIVMLDPRNGEILALARGPSFDDNAFINGISQKNYNTLLKDPDHPLFNRTLRGRYAPGSTIKPFYALMALSAGDVSPEFTLYDAGSFQVPGTKHVYHDWKRSGFGWINVTKAIEVSSDVYFYELAYKLGIDKMSTILDDFGFGRIVNIDLPHELSGILPTPDWKRRAFGNSWYTGDTIEAGIGQGFFSVTPLQLAYATGILAMKGRKFQPHIVKMIQDTNGTMRPVGIIELPPIQGLTTSAWHVVSNAMQLVIDGRHGTATHFGPHPGFTVAGKTGTAQLYGRSRDEENTRRNLPKRLRNNHLFIAFAPVNHPTIAIAVVLEHQPMPDKIAGILLRAYFKHKHTRK